MPDHTDNLIRTPREWTETCSNCRGTGIVHKREHFSLWTPAEYAQHMPAEFVPAKLKPDCKGADGTVMGAKMTELERDVAERIGRSEDPWGPRGYTGGSRRVSQAIGRLKRKGIVCIDGDGDYALTDAGNEALAAAQKEEEHG